MSTTYEQPVLQVADPQPYGVVKSAIESSFSSGRVAEFLRSLERSKLRIRDFETVLRKGALGATTAGEYNRLGNADQGQIREFYLASVEKVELKLRDKHFKIYAYY